ncbi:hypothetical protein Tco_0277654 [Tanacetum coccineum]
MGNPRDTIRATPLPAGIAERTLDPPPGEEPIENVETLLIETTPSAKEQIEGYLSALKSIVKEYNGGEIWLNGTPTKYHRTVDEMMTRVDYFVRSEEAFASTELPKEEASESLKKSSGLVSRREDRFHQGGYGADRQRNEGRSAFNSREGFVPYRAQDPYQAPRDQGYHYLRVNLNSLTKLPKEILALELQLNLQPPRPMKLPPKKENQDRYCDYHGEKGHYTNDFF